MKKVVCTMVLFSLLLLGISTSALALTCDYQHGGQSYPMNSSCSGCLSFQKGKTHKFKSDATKTCSYIWDYKLTKWVCTKNRNHLTNYGDHSCKEKGHDAGCGLTGKNICPV